MTNGRGNWVIYCSPIFRERHKRGVLLAFGVIAVAMYKLWMLNYERAIGVPFEQLMFGSWTRICITAIFAYLLSGLTFVSRWLFVSRTIIRYCVVRSFYHNGPDDLGVTVEQDPEQADLAYLMVQWGFDGCNQRVLMKFEGNRLTSVAARVRVAFFVALHDGATLDSV
ncbi:hypothetical protein [Rhodopirellula bahusiensis]|nr:hypothetical protein [Rhodopirellula bahusiensis]